MVYLSLLKTFSFFSFFAHLPWSQSGPGLVLAHALIMLKLSIVFCLLFPLGSI